MLKLILNFINFNFTLIDPKGQKEFVYLNRGQANYSMFLGGSTDSSMISPTLKSVPWKTTSSIVKAQDTLIHFYNWIPLNSPIKSYVDNHCLHLLLKGPFFLGKKDSEVP